MTYSILKSVHMLAAILTIAGFLLRGYWMLAESTLLQHRLTKVLPHFVDTVLFAAGIGMLWIMQLNPLTQSWLLAKFAGLAAYIVLGTIALKRGSTRQVRALALAAAVAAFAYVVGVALTKSPLGWLGF